MSAITVDFSLSFNVSTKKFVVVDTTDYAGQGVLAADYDGILMIKDPTSTIIYNNTNFASPDIDRATTDTNSDVDLPLDITTQEPLKGVYKITYTVSDDLGATTCEVTQTFNFQYDSPEIIIDASFDCVTPLLRSEDDTNYLVDGKEPDSIVRNHVLNYPATTGEPAIGGDTNLIQTSTMYVLDNGEALQYPIELTSTITYSYTGSGSNSGFGVTDVITGNDYLNVVCDPNLCSIYCVLEAQYKLYINTKGTKQGPAVKEKLNLMTSIAQLANIAFECNQSAYVSGYLEEIKAIAGATDNCTCGDGDIVLYKGAGIIDPGVVVAAGNGIDVAAVTVGDTTTYTVAIQDSVLDTINSFELAILQGGNQIAVSDVSAPGTRTWTIGLDLNLTVGNIPMVDATGDVLEDSPLSFDGTSLAAGLSNVQNVSFVAGATTLSVTDTEGQFVNGGFKAGVFVDGSTTAGLVASATSSAKVTVAGVNVLFDDSELRLNATEGLYLEHTNTLDVINFSLLAGEIKSEAVEYEILLMTPQDIYSGKDEYRIYSGTGDLLTITTAGKIELGVDAKTDNVEDIAFGYNAKAEDSPGNIAIGNLAVATNASGPENGSIAIGDRANTVRGGQIAIGFRAGEDSGTHNINAISIGSFSNFSAASNGTGQNSIAIGVNTQNFELASRSIAIGSNIENGVGGAITLGYSNGAALTPFGADSFNIGFNSITPQVVFSSAQSYYNLSEIMFGSTAVAPSQVSVEGDVEVMSSGNGYILKSPDLTRWRIEVDNAGVVSASLA